MSKKIDMCVKKDKCANFVRNNSSLILIVLVVSMSVSATFFKVMIAMVVANVFIQQLCQE